MSQLQVFSSPHLLGFDGLEHMLERAAKAAGNGYPPYNIERSAVQADGTEYYSISLAVAGFSKDSIEIALEDRQLTITGRQVDDPPRDYLHRGIATRQFSRSFLLADGMTVTRARLANGLLAIDLRKSAPDRVVHRIEIE
jgi:HSP20 family molecular chaperone IbpA